MKERLCLVFSWNPNTKCKELPQSSISTHPFSYVPSFSRISKPQGKNQQNGKQCCLPTLSSKISLKDAFFHISLNSLVLYLFPECSLNFIYLVYTSMCEKKFWIHGIRIPKKWIESRHFYSCHHSLLKNPVVLSGIKFIASPLLPW